MDVHNNVALSCLSAFTKEKTSKKRALSSKARSDRAQKRRNDVTLHCSLAFASAPDVKLIAEEAPSKVCNIQNYPVQESALNKMSINKNIQVANASSTILVRPGTLARTMVLQRDS